MKKIRGLAIVLVAFFLLTSFMPYAGAVSEEGAPPEEPGLSEGPPDAQDQPEEPEPGASDGQPEEPEPSERTQPSEQPASETPDKEPSGESGQEESAEVSSEPEEMEAGIDMQSVDAAEGLAPAAGEAERMDTIPCAVPEYCTDDACGCKTEGADACTCGDDCGCRTAEVHICRSPDKCINAGCLCGVPGFGAEYCICEDSCICSQIYFLVHAATEINGNPIAETLETGLKAEVTVKTYLQSQEALFSDVVYTTYIKQPLEILDLDIDFPLEIIKTDGGGQFERDVEVDGKEGRYTVIRVRSQNPVTGSVASMFKFNVKFPAGVTQSGIAADMFTVVTGVAADPAEGGATYTFGKADNGTPANQYTVQEAVCTSQAQAEWKLTLENVELDYKDPENQDNLFRCEVKLNRTPSGDVGVYYLTDSSKITFTLPGSLTAGEAAVLRVTLADGTVIEGWEQGAAPNEIVIPTDKLLFASGQTNADGYSTAGNAMFYVVFKLSGAFLLDHEVKIDGLEGFKYYDGLNVGAAFDYGLTHGSGECTDGQELRVVDYDPGSGGYGGSIYKTASPYIEGIDFFAADPGAKTIKYSVSYHNNSNTPVKEFSISDARPEMLSFTPDGSAVTPVSAAVPETSIFFKQVTLNQWNSYVEGNLDCYLVCVVNGTPRPGVLLTPGVPSVITDPGEVDEIRIEFTGTYELKHGFHVSALIEVGGDADLAQAGEQAIRDEINFLRNTAKYSGKSTKDLGKTVTGSDSFPVHIYPFDNKPEKRVWKLEAAVGAEAAFDSPAFSPTAVVRRGTDVYYRIKVYPNDATQYVYGPAFYLELPPEITLYDTGDIDGNISYHGSANNIGLSGELISNPLGLGYMLKMSSPDKVLLNPMSSGYIVVHCKVDPDMPLGSRIESRAFFGVTDANSPLDKDWYDTENTAVPGKYPYKSPGFDGEELLLESKAAVDVRGVGLLEGELWVQTEFDRGSSIWHRHPEIAKTLPGGLLTYKFVVKNGGTEDAQNIVLYNVFSHRDDSYIVGGLGQRKSKWKPYLVGAVTVPGIAGAKVYYSEYPDHAVSNNGVHSGKEDWTTNPYDYPGVEAIKIELPAGYVLPAGQTFTMEVPMYAPVNYDFPSSDAPHYAVSSLATKFNFANGGQPTALEPLKVTVQMTENQKGEISGIVWGDINKDGHKSSLGAAEFPEPDREITISSGDVAGFQPYTVKTDSAGGYKFTNLAPGTYTLTVKLPDNYSVGTVQNDNDFGTGDAGYAVTTVTITGSDKKENIDAGVCPDPAKVSGCVWRSFDDKTKRDDDASAKDIGLGGQVVELWRMMGGGVSVLFASETTSADAGLEGEYLFEDVPAGRYYTVFPDIGAYNIVERMGAPAVLGKPGNTGYSQGLQPDAANENKGLKDRQSYEIRLAAGGNEAGVDCGYAPVLGKISGNVWGDANGNGMKDTGEGVLNNKTVTLKKTGGYIGAGEGLRTAATDGSGNYLFENLTPGTYEVVYDGTAAGEYISYYNGSAAAEASRVKTESYPGIGIGPGGVTQVEGKDFGLVKKITISGIVFNDKKGANGTYEPAASPADVMLASTNIVISRVGGGLVDTQATTALAGYTSIELWPGSYTVEFTKGSCVSGADADGTAYDDYLVTTSSAGGHIFNATSRTWTMNNLVCDYNATLKDYPNQNLALTRPRTISGIVWHDVDGNKAVSADPSEEMLAQGLALKQGTTALDSTKISDASGYKYTGLYPGTYTVTVSLAEGATPSVYMITNASGNAPNTSGVYTIVVAADDGGSAADPKDKNFGLAKPVSITGKIWQDAIGAGYAQDGVYTSGEDLLQLTGVAQLYRDGVASGSPAASNASGVYQFKNLLPGNYSVGLLPSYDYYITGPAVTQVTNPNQPVGATQYAVYTFTDNTSAAKASTGTWNNIVLHSDKHITGLDLSLGKYAIISGVLWHDLDGDGVKDEAQADSVIKPGESVYISRTGTAGPELANYVDHSSMLTSETDGSYSFKVKPGEYTLTFKQGARRVTNPDTDYPAGFTVDTAGVLPDNHTATWTVDYKDNAYAYGNKDFLLSMYASISGNVWVDKNADAVFDANETARETAVVTIGYDGRYGTWWDEYAGAKTVTIDGNGNYEFPNLWPGTYTVTLASGGDGYLLTNDASTDTAVSQGTGKQWVVEVASHIDYEADFGLVKPSTLSGDVWHDADNSKTRNSEDSIGTVTLVRQNVAAGMVNATPAPVNLVANGTGFSIGGLLPGEYAMTVSGIDAYTLRTYAATALTASGAGNSAAIVQNPSNIKEFTVTITDGTGDGVDVSGADAAYVKPSGINGCLYYDDNNNDSKDGAETNVAGVTAKLEIKTGLDTYSDVTAAKFGSNAGGAFSFINLLPGEYRITFNGVPANCLTTTPDKTIAQDGVNSVFTAVTPVRTWIVTIPNDGKTATLNTGVVAKSSIAGYVWKDIDVSGAFNSEEYCNDLTVTLYKDYGETGQTAIGYMPTAGNGEYSFGGLYPGSYTVILTKADNTWYRTDTGSAIVPSNKTLTEARTVELSPNATSTGNNFGLTQLMSISGRVWLDNGTDGADGAYDPLADTPVANGAVAVSKPGDPLFASYSVQTGAGGQYIFEGLVPGGYVVSYSGHSNYVLTNSFARSDSDPGNISFDAAGREWTVERRSGYSQEGCDFALANLPVVRGLVWEDANVNKGCDSPAEGGVSGVSVAVYKSLDGGTTYTQLVSDVSFATDVDGNYWLPITATGKYRVGITLPDSDLWGVTNTAGNIVYKDFEITAMGTEDVIDFGICRYITLSGRVWVEDDGDGSYDSGKPGDVPIGDHALAVTSEHGPLGLALPVKTDAGGKFAVTLANKVFPGGLTVTFGGNGAGYIVSNRNGNFDHSVRKWTFGAGVGGVTPGADIEDVNCAFTPAREITGMVWHDLNGNGVKDNTAEIDEEFMAGLPLALQKKNTGTGEYANVQLPAPVSTGVNGDFKFTNLLPGEYRVVVVPPDGYMRTNPPAGQDQNCFYVVYTIGDNAIVSDPGSESMGLAKPVKLSAFSFIDKTSTGSYEPGVDSPVSVSIKVKRVLPDTCDVADAATDGNSGWYTCTASTPLLPGTYKVTFGELGGHEVSNVKEDNHSSCREDHSSYDPATREWTLDLKSGNVCGCPIIGYKSTGYLIKGFVWKDSDGNGIYDNGEAIFKPADGVTISARDAAGNVYTGTIGNDGRFSIAVPAPGDYEVSADFGGKYIVTIRTDAYDRVGDMFPVSIDYGNLVAEVDIGAAMPATISGMLFWDYAANGIYTPDDKDYPVGNAVIQLIDENGNVEDQTRTDSQGRYSFTGDLAFLNSLRARGISGQAGGLGVKPGNYTVKFISQEDWDALFTGYNGSDAPPQAVFDRRNGIWTLSLHEGEHIVHADSGLHKPSEISGVITNLNTGEPLGGIAVTLYRDDGTGAFVEWGSTVTDASGGYTFDRLIVGDYRIEFTIPDGFEVTDGSDGEQSGSVITIEVPITDMGGKEEENTKIQKPADGGPVYPIPTPTPTPSPSPTPSGSPSPGGTDEPGPSDSAGPTPTGSVRPTPSPSPGPTPSGTGGPSPTGSAQPTSSGTGGPAPTGSAVPTATSSDDSGNSGKDGGPGGVDDTDSSGGNGGSAGDSTASPQASGAQTGDDSPLVQMVIMLAAAIGAVVFTLRRARRAR